MGLFDYKMNGLNNSYDYATVRDLNTMLNSWDFGIVVNGRKITNLRSVDFNKVYRTLSIKDMERYKIGTSFDYVIYQRDFFNKHGIENESYCAIAFLENGIASHAFSIITLNGQKYWFESSVKSYSGIREIDGRTLGTMFVSILEMMYNTYGNIKRMDVISYDVSKTENGKSNDQIFRLMEKSKVVAVIS
jgi:hypothetical protein